MITITPGDDGLRAALTKACHTHLKAPGDRMVLATVYGPRGDVLTPRVVQPHLRGAMPTGWQYTVKTREDGLHVWRLM